MTPRHNLLNCFGKHFGEFHICSSSLDTRLSFHSPKSISVFYAGYNFHPTLSSFAQLPLLRFVTIYCAYFPPMEQLFTVQRALPWPPNKRSHLTLRVNTSTQQPMERCSTYNRANSPSRRECQRNSNTLIAGSFIRWPR